MSASPCMQPTVASFLASLGPNDVLLLHSRDGKEYVGARAEEARARHEAHASAVIPSNSHMRTFLMPHAPTAPTAPHAPTAPTASVTRASEKEAMGDINLVRSTAMTYEDAIWLAGHGGLKFCGKWRSAVEVVERAVADHDATDLKWAISSGDDAFLLLLNKTYALSEDPHPNERGWAHVHKRWEKVESATGGRVRRDDRATWSHEVVAATTFQAWSGWHQTDRTMLAWHEDGGSAVFDFWIELMLYAVSEDPAALRYVPTSLVTESMVKTALAADSSTLRFVSAELQSRFRKLVFAAVVADSAALEHVDSKLKTEAVARLKDSGVEMEYEQRFTTDTGLTFIYS